MSADPEQVSALAESLGCRPPVAAALINRGMCGPDDARAFLDPSLARARSPFLMKDIERAVDRILGAVRSGEKVLVLGDYDTDGITATALLLDFLRHLDAKVEYHIPNRMTEGYGLSRHFVENQAIPSEVNLIITVDCGISNLDAISAARRAGIDVIVTDHHEPPSVMPEAFAILNPKQPECNSGFSWLAGVGVAFNLVLALRKRLRDDGFWDDRPEPNLKAACDLVALGTVADMVPLVEENRIYVKAGLEVMASLNRPGLRALLDVCGIPNRPLHSQDVAYKLAPRLNAAGRLSNGSTSLELLTTPDEGIAQEIANELNRENIRRQKIEGRMLSEIEGRLQNNPDLLNKRALIMDGEGWHEGVVGVVASRLVDRYCRPVVVISVNDGTGRGSARSPNGFDLYEGLKACSHHLERFGGHKAAAGLTIAAEKIPAFQRDFEKIVRQGSRAEDFVPGLMIDAEICASDITPDMADWLEAFAPFGAGNPEPLFAISDLEVLSARMVGANHLQMRLQTACAPPVDAIFFDAPNNRECPTRISRLACHVRWNRWRERKKVQLIVKDLAG